MRECALAIGKADLKDTFYHAGIEFSCFLHESLHGGQCCRCLQQSGEISIDVAQPSRVLPVQRFRDLRTNLVKLYQQLVGPRRLKL